MKGKKGWMILAVFSLILIINTNSEGQQRILKWGTNMAPDHPCTLGMRRAGEIIEQKTNFKVQIYPASQLGSTQEMLEAMIAGTLDMEVENPSVLSQFSPRVGALTAPFVVQDRPQLYRVLKSEVGQELIEEMASKRGFRGIAYWSYGTRHLTNNKRPVYKVDDVMGLKIRVPNVPASVEYWKAAGASPTPMAFAEVYMALQTGVVDGQENPLPTIYFSKFYEVQKYLALTAHMIDVYLPIIRDKLWQSLNKQEQAVFLEAMEEGRKINDSLTEKQEKDLLDKIKERGVVITQVVRASFAAKAGISYKKFDSVWGADLIKRIQSVN